MTAQLLEATASVEQARHFFQLAELAADGLFTQLFGARAPAAIAAMHRGSRNHMSHRRTRFLLSEGEIAGLLHAYPARWARANAMNTIWLMLRGAGLGALRFIAVAFYLRDVLGFVGENLADDDFYIEMLAVYPRFRGRGYSKILLAEAERLARTEGCGRLTLDVAEDNRVARAAYASVGFEEIDASKPVSVDGEALRLLRLARRLPPSP